VWSVILLGVFYCRYVSSKTSKLYHFKVSNAYFNAFHPVVLANTDGKMKNVFRVNFTFISAIFKKKLKGQNCIFYTTQSQSSLATLFLYRTISIGKVILTVLVAFRG